MVVMALAVSGCLLYQVATAPVLTPEVTLGWVLAGALALLSVGMLVVVTAAMRHPRAPYER